MRLIHDVLIMKQDNNNNDKRNNYDNEIETDTQTTLQYLQEKSLEASRQSNYGVNSWSKWGDSEEEQEEDEQWEEREMDVCGSGSKRRGASPGEPPDPKRPVLKRNHNPPAQYACAMKRQNKPK